MSPIERRIASITEDRRADYTWNTKQAARILGITPTRFGDWWYRTRRKLSDLARSCPAETAAELAILIAQAGAERDQPPPPPASRA